MARAKPASGLRAHKGHGHKGYAKRMSDHVAFALITYTLMLIFVVTPSMETKGTSILPYFLLVLLVGAVIPTCRRFEHRWKMLEASELGTGGLNTRFAVDRIKLWSGAIAIPLLLSVMFRTIAAIF
jgi:hypothetical protein